MTLATSAVHVNRNARGRYDNCSVHMAALGVSVTLTFSSLFLVFIVSLELSFKLLGHFYETVNLMIKIKYIQFIIMIVLINESGQFTLFDPSESSSLLCSMQGQALRALGII